MIAAIEIRRAINTMLRTSPGTDPTLSCVFSQIGITMWFDTIVDREKYYVPTNVMEASALMQLGGE